MSKVAAFNFPTAKNKGLQEFALVLRPVVAKVSTHSRRLPDPLTHPPQSQLPTNYNLAEAASIPDNYTTAAFTLFGTPNLALPLPPSFPAPSPPPNSDQPILIHGGGSSSGQYTIQLLHLAGYTQIYATASPRNHEYLKSLGATHVFDYRSPSLAQDILAATGGKKVPIVIDTIGAKPSIEAYSPVLGRETRLAILLPVKKGPTVRNEEQDDMVTDFPPWLYEATNGATIFGVATFKIFEVGCVLATTNAM